MWVAGTAEFRWRARLTTVNNSGSPSVHDAMKPLSGAGGPLIVDRNAPCPLVHSTDDEADAG